jgi:hypothetical protein
MDDRRYSVVEAPVLPNGPKKFAIWDHSMGALCTLPDSEDRHPNLLPLEWPNAAGAESWLWQCRQAWGTGKVPAPW